MRKFNSTIQVKPLAAVTMHTLESCGCHLQPFRKTLKCQALHGQAMNYCAALPPPPTKKQNEKNYNMQKVAKRSVFS